MENENSVRANGCQPRGCDRIGVMKKEKANIKPDVLLTLWKESVLSAARASTS
jgi:hypothetical protein